MKQKNKVSSQLLSLNKKTIGRFHNAAMEVANGGMRLAAITMTTGVTSLSMGTSGGIFELKK